MELYYKSILDCIDQATRKELPLRVVGSPNREYVVPGWNDIVSDKHKLARQAFLDWVWHGKPRLGPIHLCMRRTRAAFKLALRFCRQHEEYMRAEACATNLVEHDYNKFWSSVSKISNSKATKYANSVGGAIGEEDVSKMWSDHFNQLYNSVSNDGAKNAFYDRLATINSPSVHIISVSDMLLMLSKIRSVARQLGLMA